MTAIPSWQKKAAAAPLSLLLVATALGLLGPGLAAADDPAPVGSMPDISDLEFDQPASIQRDDVSLIDSSTTALEDEGIPAVALNGYHRAADLLAEADAACELDWALVAAIGRIESNHGRMGGNELAADGVAKPGIFGLALDGTSGRASVPDTDNGDLDRDAEWDRAVGPMQIMPTMWRTIGVDADGDGIKNPQDIDDAATATGVHLCAGPGRLSDHADAEAAVRRYNASESYVTKVLAIAEAYRRGEFTRIDSASPFFVSNYAGAPLWRPSAGYPAVPRPATSRPGTSNPGTNPDDSNPGATNPGSGDPGSSTPTKPGDSTPGTSPQNPGGDTKPPKTTGEQLGEQLEDSPVTAPVAPALAPVIDLISRAEAELRCNLEYPLGGLFALIDPAQKQRYEACVEDLIGKPVGTPTP